MSRTVSSELLGSGSDLWWPSKTYVDTRLRQAANLAPVAVPLSGSTAAAVNPPVPAPVAPVTVAPADRPAAALAAVVSHFSSPPAAEAPASAMSDVSVTPTNRVVPPASSATFLESSRVTTTTPLPSLVASDDSASIQWIEAYINGLRTWLPKTQSFRFEAMSQAPLPEVGTVGMETSTGKVEHTQTIYMVAGAAPTHATDSKRVIAAAVAVGMAGFVA